MNLHRQFSESFERITIDNDIAVVGILVIWPQLSRVLAYSRFDIDVESSRDLSQQRDSSCRHPFDNEDVAVLVVASVVRMDEAAGFPLVGLAAQR
jgi:hypothetical protein